MIGKNPSKRRIRRRQRRFGPAMNTRTRAGSLIGPAKSVSRNVRGARTTACRGTPRYFAVAGNPQEPSTNIHKFTAVSGGVSFTSSVFASIPCFFG